MIIGIGGISRSGKTTLSERILESFPGESKMILHQDDFIKAGYEMRQIGTLPDWEDPESIDFHRLTHEFSWLIKHLDLVILEGLFAFAWKPIHVKYDKKILLRLDYDCFHRRKKEDLRWGKVEEWYIRHIWESHQVKGIPDNQEDMLILDGCKPYDMQVVWQYLGLDLPECATASPSDQGASKSKPFSHR